MSFYWHLIYLTGLILCTTAYTLECLKNRKLAIAYTSLAIEAVILSSFIQNDPRFAQPLPKKEENANDSAATH